MRWKLLIGFIAIFVVGTLSGRFLWSGVADTGQSASASGVIANAEAKCIPHGIAADQCTRCNPSLIPSFKESGDWCAEHNVPESQCDLCGGGNATASPSAGMCAEHGVPESQCTRCHPDLIEHFKAINDWCAGHKVPESQCELCGFGKVHGQAALCDAHGVAEAQCARCHPDLVAHFKALGDWCAGHDVPESQCELCGGDASAVDAGSGMCVEHGILESQCARCNPGLIEHYQAIGDWCAGHKVPESQCKLCGFGKVHGQAALCDAHGVAEAQCARCNPDLIAHFKAINDWCAGHDVPESQCELCDHGTEQSRSGLLQTAEATEIDPARQSMSAPYPGIAVSFESAEPQCPTDGAIIQFASVETLQRAGITVQPVTTAPFADPFEAPAEVEFDQTATTYMSSTLPITIRQWLVEPGDFVQEGTPLARVESPDMAALQGEYLEAWSDWHVHKRERARAETLMARSLIDSASYDRAIADAIASEGRAIQKESQLRLAGMADVDLEVLRDHRLVSSTFQLRAPVSGTVLERPANLGSILDPGIELVTIGNPKEIWVEASVHERDLNRVRLGQQVVFQSDAGSTNPVVGTVTWISQFLDPHTRTGIVRMEPQNGTHRLRAHEFGQMRLSDDLTRSATIISKDAVQWEGCCNVVFVMDTPDRFYPRKVEVERLDNDHYRVVSGLSPGDKIAVNGSFLLKTELKKSSIGAGCCGLDAAS